MKKAPPLPPLPPISPTMQAFFDKSFKPHPDMWFEHLERHEASLDSQLVARGLIEKETIKDPEGTRARYRLAQSKAE